MNKNKLLTIQTSTATQQMLLNYICGRFEWSGLPEGLDSRRLEYFITMQGCAALFTKDRKTLGLPATPTGKKSLMWEDVEFIAYGFNKTFTLDRTQCVPVYNNTCHSDMISAFETTCKDLDDILFSARVNVKCQKNPWAFGGTQDEIRTLQAALEKVNENGALLFMSKQGLASVETAKRFFPITVPVVTAELMQQYRTRLNDFLTLLGMDSVPIEKKERLISDEAHSNDSVVLFNRNDQLRQRELACEEFNKRYFANLSVKWVGCSDCEGGEESGTAIL